MAVNRLGVLALYRMWAHGNGGRTHGGVIRQGKTCRSRINPHYWWVSLAGSIRDSRARGVHITATHADRTGPCGAPALHPDLFLPRQRPERGTTGSRPL